MYKLHSFNRLCTGSGIITHFGCPHLYLILFLFVLCIAIGFWMCVFVDVFSCEIKSSSQEKTLKFTHFTSQIPVVEITAKFTDFLSVSRSWLLHDSLCNWCLFCDRSLCVCIADIVMFFIGKQYSRFWPAILIINLRNGSLNIEWGWGGVGVGSRGGFTMRQMRQAPRAPTT